MTFGDPRLPERFWAKVIQSRSGCWIWTSSQNRGHAVFYVDGRNRPAYRYAFDRLVRPVDDDEHVHHECGRGLCVNPAHLRAVTPKAHAAAHAATHCKRGHAFNAENTHIRPCGSRCCRACDRERKHTRK